MPNHWFLIKNWTVFGFTLWQRWCHVTLPRYFATQPPPDYNVYSKLFMSPIKWQTQLLNIVSQHYQMPNHWFLIKNWIGCTFWQRWCHVTLPRYFATQPPPDYNVYSKLFMSPIKWQTRLLNKVSQHYQMPNHWFLIKNWIGFGFTLWQRWCHVTLLRYFATQRPPDYNVYSKLFISSNKWQTRLLNIVL